MWLGEYAEPLSSRAHLSSDLSVEALCEDGSLGEGGGEGGFLAIAPTSAPFDTPLAAQSLKCYSIRECEAFILIAYLGEIMKKKILLFTGLLLSAGPQLLEAGSTSCRKCKKCTIRKNKRKYTCKKCGTKLAKRRAKCPKCNR